MNAYDIVRRPRLTEKTVQLQNTTNTYTFEVHQDANKIEIRKAVESLFKVKVMAVRTLNVRGKPRRIRGSAGVEAAWKKAYVKVADGQKIEGV
ncbi:MAG: 50S ribosomal protein L23 [Planctomycetes bacterium]|nr:50S ribosomal protein L23 [Planctomycetota bacterium]